MKSLFSKAFKVSAAMACLTFGAAAQAESPVVVELFTSQGCSSCPPADEMLHALAERDDVIALALHVDYWDYIGWKDEFAQAAFTTRQREYAILGGRRSVYTPQMIINGETDVVGARAMKLSEAISHHAADRSAMDVVLERDGSTLKIKADAHGTQGPFVVQMVRYKPKSEVRITRGENAGRTLSYANVAQDWQVLAKWDGAAPLSLKTGLEGSDPVVVIVQKDTFGPIIGAARLR